MSRLEKIGQNKLLFSLFGLLILIISLVFFALSLVKPYIGTSFSKGAQGWFVSDVDNAGLAKFRGIIVGDKTVEINNQSAQTFLDQYNHVGVVLEPSINELTVTDNQEQSISVTLKGSSQPVSAITELASWFIVSIVFWITGYYVFRKTTKSEAAILLYLCGLALGLVLSTNQAVLRAIPTATFIEVAASLIGPWLLVHFFLVLPDEGTQIRSNHKLYWIYLPAIITIALFPLIGYRAGQPVLWFRSLRLFEIGIGFLVAAGVAIFNYIKARSIKLRQQMKIVLIGCIAALVPLIVLIVLPEAINGHGQPIIPAGFSILFVVFIPLGMGYSIITQKLMDIDVIIRRSIIYGLITVIMAALISAALVTAVTFQKYLGTAREIVLCLVLGGAATALFGPTKMGIEEVVDRYFYKDRYDYRQIIQSLSDSLNSVKSISDISRLVVGTTVQTLNLAGGCLCMKNLDGSYEITATQGIFLDTRNRDKVLGLISPQNNGNKYPNAATHSELDISFLIPLMAGGKEVGILCISQKSTKQAFSSDDLYLLEGIASVSAMALHSALLTRDVSVRDTFVSIASHELRSPLTSILGYTELLINKDPPEVTRKKWLKHILDNSQKVTDMVDDLLNVTRIQSGKVVMKLEKVKLSNILNERVSIAQESTNTHKFVVNLEPNLPDVLVDRDKFGEVIGNLLSNAIKYSPNGGNITLSAKYEPQSHRVVVSVIDEGMGIGQEDQGLLFTTFHRIQRPETRSIKGSGLGLYIAKEWTKAMGGEIWLKSELNKGSTFFIAIPAQDT
jgi:nitrogen-specific signal transduction histidine kinase